MKKNKIKGFTLVELLAVIVILAIILVIAVPKVMTIIEDTKKATLETTAKMIANAAEKAKIQNEILGKTDKITCDDVAKMNKVDYESCEIEFDGNTAKVDIAGKNKFAGLYVCEGTKTLATATENSCGPEETPATCFTYENIQAITVTDVDKCTAFLETVWPGNESNYAFCKNGVDYGYGDYNNEKINYYKIEEIIYAADEETLKQSEGIIVEDTIQITGYDINCGTDVVIPSKINDLKVTDIGQRAFQNTGITSVKFPNTILYINEAAFAGALNSGTYYGEGIGSISGVIDLSKASNLRAISEFAFIGNQITDVYLPDNLLFVSYNAFGSNKINNLKLGKNLEAIALYSFVSNSLTTIEIPSKVTDISSSAFDENPNLTKVINKTGKSMNWARILGDRISECTFETGTCGTVSITSN